MQIFDEKFSNCLRFSIKLKNKFVSLLHENAAMHLHPYIKKPRLLAEEHPQSNSPNSVF